MKRIGRKLGSKRGASITFALLLFLVCAVISATVIVAGTAAAGRMSRLVEMDQRYYAVTSAGELLRDVFDDIEYINLEYQETPGDPPVRTCGDVIAHYVDGSEAIVRYQDGTIKGVSPNTFSSEVEFLLVEASKQLVEYTGAGFSNAIFEQSISIELASDAGLPGNVALDCDIQETLRKDGLLEFMVSNKIPTGLDPQYKLKIVFASNVQEIATDAYSLTKKAAVTWSLHDIVKWRNGKPTT